MGQYADRLERTGRFPYYDEDEEATAITPGDILDMLPRTRRRSNLLPFLLLLVVLPSAVLVGAIAKNLFSYGGRMDRRASFPLIVAPANTPVPGPTPTPAPIKGRFTILLLGSDKRDDDNGFRTDVMLLLLVDATRMKVSAVSFPRDLWVKVPSMYEMKINQVQGLGGFKATAEMMEVNFGVKPSYYVMTNFDGFVKAIDLLGGVNVEIGKELTDDCDLPQQKDGDCTVKPGSIYMDGATALWYVRSRYTSSDFDRLRRAQEVIQGVLAKFMTINGIKQLPELQKELSKDIETNLSIKKATDLLPVALKVYKDPSRIKKAAITEEQATPSWSWNGLWILMPDKKAIHQVLEESGFFSK